MIASQVEGLPEDERNDTVIQRYAANRLRVVPQLRYSLDKADEIDLALRDSRCMVQPSPIVIGQPYQL